MVFPSLPIVSTEHVTAVTVSVKDKLTLSLGVAVGSSIVRPFMVSSQLPMHPLMPPVPRHTANRTIRHPVHCDARLDTWEASQSAL